MDRQRSNILFWGVMLLLGSITLAAVAYRLESTKSPLQTASDTRKLIQELGGTPSGGVPIALFVTPTCPVCKAAEQYLLARNIPFSKFDVQQNTAAQKAFFQLLNGSGVPLIVVGTEVLLGFNPELFQAALEGAATELG
ncbi:MAG: hypothetical protein KDD44_15330 [Bdellovibrionales bacterium]|nr:hypothetical protein [Bdellovibrionales bacterium]